MNRFTNHTNLKKLLTASIILFTILFCVFLTNCDNTNNDRFIRKNIHSPEAKDDINALNKALAIMRTKDCQDPLSWYYQGSIHWIPDTINNNKFCPQYKNISNLMPGWDNCTHTPEGTEKLHFLLWHRLYIWHFEKIVRKLSQKEDFALPYWSYQDGGDNKCLPDLFGDKSTALYESARFDSLNNGYPVSGEITRALDLTKLMSYTNYKSFCLNINAAPHGAMHDYIGAGNDTSGTQQFNNGITGTITNTGLMGWVPTAAFDPIFWTHHSNIDRIWQQWTNSPNGVSVTLEQLKAVEWPYVFFDENGEKVEYTVEQAWEIMFNLDYDFDDTPIKSKEPKLLATENKKPLSIESKPKSNVSSKLTNLTKIETPLTSTGSKNGVRVVMTVSFTKLPKGVYEVYYNLSDGETPQTNGKNFAGFMTFFGADHKTQGESCLKGCCRKLNRDGRPEVTFEYEIPQSAEYNFSIYKHNGKHVGDLVIEKIEILAN